MTKRAGTKQVRVWDLPVRIGHWALVALVAIAMVTGEDEGLILRVHLAVGYLVLAIVVFRLGWGVIGSEHARFADFVRPFAAVRAYAVRLLALRPPIHLGHNPLGGWMILGLIATLVLVVASGIAAEAGLPNAGGLARFVPGILGRMMGEVHEGVANLLILLALVHVAGVAIHRLLTGERLVRAMITGAKEVPDDIPAADYRPANPVLATLWSALTALFAAYLLGWI